ncbi:hypothetical protein PLESTM_001559300 [Pleodorina starrii]|nr:hypothetical protein PLESTM_001559300 [Pleodorina starrii]
MKRPTENLAGRVPDRVRTGINETELALFLADFRANFGSGANLEEARTLWQETDVYRASQLGRTVYNTLTAAAQLGIAAIQAGPFAVIGLIVISLGLASSITSLIGGILYASASGVGLYASVATAISNQCSAGTASSDDGGGGGDGGMSAGAKAGGSGDGGDGDDPDGEPDGGFDSFVRSAVNNKNPNNAKPAINCFEVQKQAAKWLRRALDQSRNLNRYLMPYVFRGGVDDGLLAITEGILRSSINLARMVQSVA